MLRTHKAKLVLIEEKKSIRDGSRSYQVPSKDQITEIAPYAQISESALGQKFLHFGEHAFDLKCL